MKQIDFFSKFRNLDLNNLKVDFHLHSTWTDGKNTISEIINCAKKNDLHSIAITDHIRMQSTFRLY